jgi:hypothetical protein
MQRLVKFWVGWKYWGNIHDHGIARQDHSTAIGFPGESHWIDYI